MFFSATPTNLTAVLVCVPAFLAVLMLLRKRYDTNLPLLFYFLAVMFTNFADRPVDPFIMYGGLGSALLLRFEFMGTGFSRFVAWCANTGLCLMIWSMLAGTVG
jgi:hypothetical protein